MLELGYENATVGKNGLMHGIRIRDSISHFTTNGSKLQVTEFPSNCKLKPFKINPQYTSSMIELLP